MLFFFIFLMYLIITLLSQTLIFILESQKVVSFIRELELEGLYLTFEGSC